MIKIDKNIPAPESNGNGRPRIYPFDDMEVGDSFFVPGMKVDSLSGPTNVAAKRTGFRFSKRTVDGGVRVWRVE